MRLSGISFRTYRIRAFTLAELAVVMAIMGIMAAVAVPRFASAISRQRKAQACNRITTDMDYARRLAIQKSTPVTMAFDVANDSYTIEGVPHLDDPGKDYHVELNVDPYRVHMLAADFGGNAKVTYDMYGIPDNEGGVVIDAKGDASEDVIFIAVKGDDGEVDSEEVEGGGGGTTLDIDIGGKTIEIDLPILNIL